MAFQLKYDSFLNRANRSVTKTSLKRDLRNLVSPLDVQSSLLFSLDVSPATFRDTYLYHTVFDKYCEVDPATASERERRCLEKYLSCEKQCQQTNRYFSLEQFRGTSVHHLLMLTRKHLSNILGTLPSNWYERSKFGPGSTTRLSRQYSDAVFKLEGKPHCTSLLLPFVQSVYTGIWDGFEVVDAAKYTSVPKNAEINRPIEIQPDMNIYMQKSLGNIIRSRMFGRYCGSGFPVLDLNNQENNRYLALVGSSTDPSICTIDLSSASDLLATNFVSYLIEDRSWLLALYLTRVGLVDVGGNTIPLNKFSAMGNGYTWELQSAIFYSMVRACNEYLGVDDYVCSVFGDDIICHKDVYPVLSYFLAACGLKVNHKKSFVSGFFRESCGKHYYKGVDVTPFYLRSPLQTNQEIVMFHNRVFEWATKLGYKDIRMKPLLDSFVGLLTCRRLYCPPLYGDCALHSCRSDIEYGLVEYKRSQMYVKVHSVTRSILDWPRQSALTKWLHGYRSDTQSASCIPFGISRSAVSRLPIIGWPTFGDWC